MERFTLENRTKVYLLLLFLFASTQVLGVLYQFTLFEIERLEKPGVLKRESETLSPYRETSTPLILFALIFVIAINLYLFLFRLDIAARILMLFIYVSAIFSFAIITQILVGIALSLLSLVVSLPAGMVAVQGLIFIASLIVPSILLLTKRYQTVLRVALGISLCAIAGAVVASFFTLKTILALLAILSLYDYVFVKKTRHIPKIVKMLDKHNVLLTLDIGPRRPIEEPPEPLKVLAGDRKIVRVEGRRLGFGDLIFATGLSVATYIDKNVPAAMIMVLFTTLSLGAFLYYLQRTGNTKPQPAIPPIFIGGLMGAIFSILLF